MNNKPSSRVIRSIARVTGLLVVALIVVLGCSFAFLYWNGDLDYLYLIIPNDIRHWSWSEMLTSSNYLPQADYKATRPQTITDGHPVDEEWIYIGTCPELYERHCGLDIPDTSHSYLRLSANGSIESGGHGHRRIPAARAREILDEAWSLRLDGFLGNYMPKGGVHESPSSNVTEIFWQKDGRRGRIEMNQEGPPVFDQLGDLLRRAFDDADKSELR